MSDRSWQHHKQGSAPHKALRGPQSETGWQCRSRWRCCPSSGPVAGSTFPAASAPLPRRGVRAAPVHVHGAVLCFWWPWKNEGWVKPGTPRALLHCSALAFMLEEGKGWRLFKGKGAWGLMESKVMSFYSKFMFQRGEIPSQTADLCIAVSSSFHGCQCKLQCCVMRGKMPQRSCWNYVGVPFVWISVWNKSELKYNLVLLLLNKCASTRHCNCVSGVLSIFISQLFKNCSKLPKHCRHTLTLKIISWWKKYD